MIPAEAVEENVPMTIIEFLEARIAEDEAHARAAIAGDGVAAMIVWRVPHMVLAECAAKRAIIDAVEPGQWYSNPSHSGYSDAMGVVIDTLAMVYKDHPDYRQEWAL